MKPMKFKKISDEHNTLGYDELIFVSRDVMKIHTMPPTPRDKEDYSYEPLNIAFYTHEWSVICDKCLITITDDEWCNVLHCYEFVGFVSEMECAK